MGQIRQQNINKQLELAKKEKQMKESGPAGMTHSSHQPSENKTESVKVVNQEFEEDNLISYREFMQAVKNIKNVDDPNPNERKFYDSLLPRTLTFL